MSAVEDPGDVARLYIAARKRAKTISTRRLARAERTFRRDANDPERSIDEATRAEWSAARWELAARGRRLPATDDPSPRRLRWRR